MMKINRDRKRLLRSFRKMDMNVDNSYERCNSPKVSLLNKKSPWYGKLRE